MGKLETYKDMFERSGLSRREFLRFCSYAATAAGMNRRSPAVRPGPGRCCQRSGGQTGAWRTGHGKQHRKRHRDVYPHLATTGCAAGRHFRDS